MPYYVVEFEGGYVEVVPDNWLTGDDCYWTSSRGGKVVQDIKSKRMPDQTWKKYTIKRWMKKCKTFEKADRKATKARYESDLSSTEPVTDTASDVPVDVRKRATKKPAAYSPDHLPSKQARISNLKTSDIPPSLGHSSLPPVPRELLRTEAAAATEKPEGSASSRKPNDDQSESGDEDTLVEADADAVEDTSHVTPSRDPPVSRAMRASTPPRSTTPSSASSARLQHSQSTDTGAMSQEQFRALMAKLNRIDVKLDYLARKVNVGLTKTSSTGAASELPRAPEGMTLPADSVRDMVRASELVARETRTRNNMVRYLGTFCGTTVTDSVARIMSAVMTNSLALQFNWTGAQGKQSFAKLKLSPVICDAVRLSDAAVANLAVEVKIKAWLRQARDRDGGRRRRFFASEKRRSAASSESAVSQLVTDDDSTASENDLEPGH